MVDNIIGLVIKKFLVLEIADWNSFWDEGSMSEAEDDIMIIYNM